MQLRKVKRLIRRVVVISIRGISLRYFRRRWRNLYVAFFFFLFSFGLIRNAV